MNTYDSLKRKKHNTVLGAVLALLILLEVCSLIVLFSRITSYAPTDGENMFPLTESIGATKVQVGHMGADGEIAFGNATPVAVSPVAAPIGAPMAVTLQRSAQAPVVAEQVDFAVYDENTVWQAQTDVEIFKISYANGESKVTVAGENNEKVIAPGTENQYTFHLKNTEEVALDYTMTMEAYFSNTELAIPVQAKLSDAEGNYLVGSKDTWEDVLQLNGAGKQGIIGANKAYSYTLEWQWPFEGDDGYDTMLGNLATEEDLSLTIVIRTTAMQNADPEHPGDTPQTGDDAPVYLWVILLIVAAVGIIFLLRGGKKDK